MSDTTTPINPMLGAYQLNIGATKSRLPLANSPSTDIANPIACTGNNDIKLTYDQNGQFRHQDGSLSGTDRCNRSHKQ